jgi:tripartite-type tricarboxylate transporter receptor subunit TctC
MRSEVGGILPLISDDIARIAGNTIVPNDEMMRDGMTTAYWHRRAILKGMASAAFLAGGLRGAAAQLESKQIRLIVPFPAGGPTDIVARPFAQLLSDALKANVIIDNRGGAGGSIGADAAAKAEPDGTTIMMGTVGTHAINGSLYAKLPYDPVKSFTPIALVAMAPVAIVVNPSQPIQNVKELVALAKQKPGALNYASAGVGTPGHLTGELFKAAAGIDIQHVPYKGSAPAVTDIVAGQVQIMFDPLQSVLSNIKGGRLRALAVSSKTRSPVAPDVPTVAESGYPDFETTAWWGVFAPAGLDGATAAALTKAAGQVAQSKDFRGKLEPLGVSGANLVGADLAAFQKNEIEKWGKAVRGAGLKPQ